MPIRVSVNSNIQAVKSIYIIMNGSPVEVKNVWTFVNGQLKQLWPSTEEWTLIAQYNGGESYNLDLGFGKYNVVYAGGGGSGCAVSSRADKVSTANRIIEDGYPGAVGDFNFNIRQNSTSNIHGVVGKGAAGSYATSRSSYANGIPGTPGTGSADGSAGTWGGYQYDPIMCSGSGGGATSFIYNNSYYTGANGGAGGSGSVRNKMGTSTLSKTGGSGGVGGGGVMRSDSPAGGAGVYGTGQTGVTSGAGADGFVKIYKSNIYPT